MTWLRFMKSFVFIALVSGIIFGFAMGMLELWDGAEGEALEVGVMSGAIYGIVMGLFIAGMQTHIQLKFEGRLGVSRGERVVKEGFANHRQHTTLFRWIRAPLGVGGWLYLTNRRLLFRPHRVLQKQATEVEIPLANVGSAQAKGSGWTQRLLCLQTSAGEVTFVIRDQAAWAEEINRARV